MALYAADSFTPFAPIEEMVFYNGNNDELKISTWNGGVFCINTVTNTRLPIASYPIETIDGKEVCVKSFVEIDCDGIWELTTLGEALLDFLNKQGENLDENELMAEFNFADPDDY